MSRLRFAFYVLWGLGVLVALASFYLIESDDPGAVQIGYYLVPLAGMVWVIGGVCCLVDEWQRKNQEGR